MIERYLEDYAVGQTFGSGRMRVDKELIKAFAAEFDPQPFHLDEALAAGTIFRGLAASGWHTVRSPCGYWSTVSSSPPAA
jgi:acyl dehydratase